VIAVAAVVSVEVAVASGTVRAAAEYVWVYACPEDLLGLVRGI
jgi:hypothetical protein